MYRSDTSVRDLYLAQTFIPEEFSHSPRLAETAISLALSALIPPEELVELRYHHRLQYEQERKSSGYYQGEGHTSRSRQGALVRKEQRTEEEKKAMIERLRAVRGSAWSDEEKAYTEQVLLNPDFQIQSGKFKGAPNYPKIAEVINHLFHGGAEVRSATSISSTIRGWRYQQKRVTT